MYEVRGMERVVANELLYLQIISQMKGKQKKKTKGKEIKNE
nr:MAG: hypothetical protein [Bacteriophage sp.]